LLHDAVTPQRLFPALCSGLVVGLLLIVIQLSLASLIFSGPLAAFAPQASGLTLFGTFVMCLVVALFSSFPTAICVPEDAPAAVITSVAAGIAVSLAGEADPRAAYVTIGAAMVLSTMGTGALFLILGRFQLGNPVRYMPYPVVAGFLAGVGWLLTVGGMDIMTGGLHGLADLARLFSAEQLRMWLPGLALALAMLAVGKYCKSGMGLPATIGAAWAVFAAVLWISGQSLADAQHAGLLLGDMGGSTRLWPVFTPTDLRLIRWDVLAIQIPQLCTIPLVSAISFLLISSGLEAIIQRDLNMRHELYLNGIANLLAGPGGSQAGYTALSFSMLGSITGSNSRLVGVTTGLLCGGAVFFGASLLCSVPRFILGGLTLFMGFATLLDWAVRVRTSMTRAEYALVLAILCSIGAFGFLPGVAFGLVLAVAVFVVKYSQLPVARQESAPSGALASTVRRSVPEQHILQAHADEISVLHIAGYLFFGSANTLNRMVSEYLDPQSGKRFTHLLLDFSEVDGFDSSALNCLLRMVQRCKAAGMTPLFASAPEGLPTQMRRTAPGDTQDLLFLPSLDSALEWCEADILARFESQKTKESQDALFDSAVDDLLAQIEQSERFEALLERMAPYLETREFAQGELIQNAGEFAGGVLFLVSGQAEETQSDETASVRLGTLNAGALLGRATQEQHSAAASSIIALTACSLKFLSFMALTRMEEEDPRLALGFYHLYTGVAHHG